MSRPTAPIDRVVRDLAQRLPGPLLRPPGMLLEVRHGLEDATASYREAGLDARSAAARAVADFGDLDEVAGAYAEQTVARSTSVAALALGPGYLAILAAWTLTGLGGSGSDPSHAPEASSIAFRYLGALAAVVAVCALFELRRRSRTGLSCRSMAILVGTAGILTSGVSLAVSYAVEPWAWSLVGRAGQRAGVAEAFSATVTMVTITLAARCLLTVGRLRSWAAPIG